MTEEQRRAIEADVARLIHAYTWANDAADWQTCARLMTEDAVLVRPSGGDPVIGRAAILAAFQARPPRAQRHVIANVLVDVLGAGEATARSVIVLHTGRDMPPLVGTYTDRCVMTADGWRFAERRGALDFTS